MFLFHTSFSHILVHTEVSRVQPVPAKQREKGRQSGVKIKELRKWSQKNQQTAANALLHYGSDGKEASRVK